MAQVSNADETPGDYTMSLRVPDGFLSTVIEMLSERYPRLSRDYLLSVGEVLPSSCGWKAYILDKYGKLSLNTWIQIIAPSGDGKSLPDIDDRRRIRYFLN
ncbi:MAG: hypothetical protein QG670_1417 [Thermoproteota archaeon]|nr:hypothetical protein [Thermoproteota archaeon]